MNNLSRNYGDHSLKRTRAREEIRALAQRRNMEIVPARSMFLRCVFLLAQEGVPFLLCICYEHNHDCDQCYGKKYFHAPRIAPTGIFVLCKRLTNTKQKCKFLRLLPSIEISISVQFTSSLAVIQSSQQGCLPNESRCSMQCVAHTLKSINGK